MTKTSSSFLLKYAIMNNALSKRQISPSSIPREISDNSIDFSTITSDATSDSMDSSTDHSQPSYLAVVGHFLHFGISTRDEKVWLSFPEPNRDSGPRYTIAPSYPQEGEDIHDPRPTPGYKSFTVELREIYTRGIPVNISNRQRKFDWAVRQLYRTTFGKEFGLWSWIRCAKNSHPIVAAQGYSLSPEELALISTPLVIPV